MAKNFKDFEVNKNFLGRMISSTMSVTHPLCPRRGDTLKRFEDFNLKARARIWP